MAGEVERAPKAPWIDRRITVGNIVTICLGVVSLAIAWATLTADVKALTLRVDKSDDAEVRSAVKASDLRDAVIELRTEQRGIARSIEKIERYLIPENKR